ncbi:MAG: hypothetical protein JXA30_13460 [Deltaproteobacteria bacterium]|nr:hypothetical protein [Deltaproteobacteria bacterium]
MVRKDILRIRIGRDRITEVLEPHLGPSNALERANNIAQALAFTDDDPAHVALEMLGKTGLANTREVAAKVGQVWLLSLNQDVRSH